MKFRLLGHIEIEDERGPVVLAGRQQRVLLAQLLLRANSPVPAAVLIERLWPDRPPRTASTALRVLLSSLRRALGGGTEAAPARSGERLVRAGGGWMLRVGP